MVPQNIFRTIKIVHTQLKKTAIKITWYEKKKSKKQKQQEQSLNEERSQLGIDEGICNFSIGSKLKWECHRKDIIQTSNDETSVMRQKAHWIELRENQMYHNNDNIINIIELYTLKGWSWEISCHTAFYHSGKLNNKLKIIAKNHCTWSHGNRNHLN